MNPDGTQDKSTVSLYDRDSGGEFFYGVLNAEGGTEALKITSRASDIHVGGNEIHGGTEDCLDLNNECQRVSVEFSEWHANGQYLVTCKGGCSDITLSGCIVRHGDTTDVDLDNVSEQSTKPTSNIRLNLTTRDGSAVKVRCLGPNSPIILNPEQRYEITQSKRLGALFKLLRALLALFRVKI